MSDDARLLLLHGDDGFRIGQAIEAFARRIDAAERTEVVPERSPDEPAIDRARLAASTVALFGPHLAVLRQPLRAAGRSGAAADRLVALVAGLPAGAALVLAEEQASREVGRPQALLRRVADAVRARGGEVEEVVAPRRGELRGWIVAHAKSIGVTIEPAAAARLAERVGGAMWETDVERGEQTRLADAELRKLGTYAEGRAITAADVDALTADTRPASLYAISNAIDRRDPAAAATALARALREGQPVLRIMAALAGRIADLIVARELLAAGAPPGELARRVGRGNARAAERVAEASRRYRGDELERMLRGLFDADVAIKTNAVDPEPALAAWLGEHVLGATRDAR
ncbi:MAG TPA: DNA polymerase III subunit delta [Candidatus Limnocylindria bacterium]|nr:DNA polymerase III subunit delta [Candidatus Limnocylindria bacterium]